MTIWRALHFVLALTIPLAVLLLVSCKQAHESHADLGPQFNPNQLNGILQKASDDAYAHAANLKTNQTLHYEESLRVNNSDPDMLLSTNDLKVLDASFDQDTHSTRITTQLTSRALDTTTNQWSDPFVTEDTIDHPEDSFTSSGLLMNFSSSLSITSSAPVTRVTYHNLRISEGDIDAPDKAKAKPNCANVPNCKIHVTFVSYDEVNWTDDTNYVKRSYDFQLTAGLPFMQERLYGIMTLGCVGGFQIVNGHNYYLRDCQYLTDLQM